MTPEEIAAKEAATAAAEKAEAEAKAKAEAEKKPLHSKYTEKEKAEYSLKMNAERLKELGGDPKTILGNFRPDDSLSDDTPLTYGKLKELQKEEAKKTSLQMAEEIVDEKERDEVKIYLNDHIKPSGNPQKDLTIARAAVGAVRTSQIAEEQARKTQANLTAAGGSAPAKTEAEFTPTAEELVFMGSPYRMSKEDIVKAREKASQSQK